MEQHRMTHEIDVSAPEELVYRLIADAAKWPLRFDPTVHVERTALGAGAERLAIWALANGEVKHWTSRRDLDAGAGRVRFRQEVSTPPVASMGGEWVVTPEGAGSRLTLHHEFTAIDDDPAGVAWIRQATDSNSRAELANLKALAETAARRAELTFSFSDEVVIASPAEPAYEFLYAAGRWPERLPHVAGLELREPTPNLQLMTMETKAADGSVHTTESARVCFPHHRIVYKQLVPPKLMTAHLGEWSCTDVPGGVRVTAAHTVTVNEPAIAAVLGRAAGVPEAKRFLRRAVGGNSRATLELTKRFAEAARG
ncbi:aromatase/cyclase [Actinomadura harenae]|uniref:Cyclase n=1 Tax=Actinomadura harenae TaxID=2483351 RepID=A0A3M2M0U0_9ACTN|nr:aromatase/cyclase [Actinomadura harenae]RMI43207.1 cyclase [Actinomadura harenae]